MSGPAPRAAPPGGAAPLAWLRLLQLASPALPVGAYTYSQGLEWAVEGGGVRTEADVAAWLSGALRFNVGSLEAPLLAALMRAWRAGDVAEAARLDAEFLASRESAELRAETVQMGYSLARLLDGLDAFAGLPGWRARLAGLPEPSSPAAWAAAAAAWDVPQDVALTAYLWAWLENQVMAAVKAVPLGQSAGQRLLATLAAEVPPLVERALAADEGGWSNFTPGLALASCAHETQYTRLFRS